MYRFVDKWFYVAENLPENGEIVYFRFANNEYNPNYAQYNSINSTFVTLNSDTIFSSNVIVKWARLL